MVWHDRQAYKIPISPAHLQAAIASFMNVTISIADDVFECMTTTPSPMASPAILHHSIRSAEVVP
jgi:hypothetical protein